MRIASKKQETRGFFMKSCKAAVQFNVVVVVFPLTFPQQADRLILAKNGGC